MTEPVTKSCASCHFWSEKRGLNQGAVCMWRPSEKAPPWIGDGRYTIPIDGADCPVWTERKP